MLSCCQSAAERVACVVADAAIIFSESVAATVHCGVCQMYVRYGRAFSSSFPASFQVARLKNVDRQALFHPRHSHVFQVVGRQQLHRFDVWRP